ncbi:Bifunctional protein FolD protein [Candidatus Bilamarchaeum dharawalense]|uniref:Bifunctional protein FolD n=1 Tax=Candidatus Bilamarchaeum dharawalense TaxID=2885759 RepID=A0A5E4LMY0_9ARCH|nr:Bifunctional protein FolD protein [Candidatus Bilamarchaeum dharawalense]
MYKSLTGKEPAASIMEDTKKLLSKLKRKPRLAIVLAGNDPASEVYVKKKIKRADEVGIETRLEKLPENISEKSLIDLVHKLNTDDSVDGFIVQYPLPKHINYFTVVETIDPKKDVDGWTSTNIGKMFLGFGDSFLPATPIGVIRMLEFYGVDLVGKNATVIGRGNVVGKPLAFLLLARHATVTICHSKTKNLAEHTRTADILVSAAGVPGLVKADMVKEGAFVIDVGTTRVGDRIRGDVDYENVIKKANCSPVPHGVGPMTIAMLLHNTVKAAKMRL